MGLPIFTFILSASAAVTAALSDPSRPAEDQGKDAARKPADMLDFSGIKAGDRVADLFPGGGYFTRPFSKIVGPKGKVFAIVPPPTSLGKISDGFAKALQHQIETMKALGSDKAYANVTALAEPLVAPLAPEPLDLVWTSQNYHDVYGYSGAEAAAKLDAAVFAALKPGELFIVEDHAAAAGSGARDATTLHRIDPATVKAQVLAAGFTFEGESSALRNDADKHTAKVFDPEIRGHTDQFVMKFKKPATAK